MTPVVGTAGRHASWRSIATSSFPIFVGLYAALYGAYGTESPFLPAFFSERGLDASAIGTVLTAGTVVRLSAGPLLGNLADHVGARRVLLAAAAGSGLVGLGYLGAHGFWSFLLVCMIHSMTTTSLAAISDALCLAASAAQRVFAYGWVRGVGSAAFIAGTLSSGRLVASFGTASIIVSSSILFLLMMPSILAIPHVKAPAHEAASGGIRAILAIPAMRRVLLVAGLVIGSHAMSDAFAVIHWQDAHVGAGTIGLLWSEAVLSEVVVFLLVGPLFLARFGPVAALVVGSSAGIVRWGVLAQTSSVPVLAGAQLLHGLTFALVHLACVRLITELCPPRLTATAQSLYGTLALGLGSAVLTFLSGILYQHHGAEAFWLMSLLCLTAIPVALSLGRPGEVVRKRIERDRHGR